MVHFARQSDNAGSVEVWPIFILYLIYREEQEKLNVWVALMNLENLYGTQESLVKVFERALQQNEPKKIFFQLIGIYTRTDKVEVCLPRVIRGVTET